MIKNVTVQTPFTTGAENLALADTVIGRIAEPQTRWSPGALVAAIIAAATSPLVVIATADSVNAWALDTEAHALAARVALGGVSNKVMAYDLTPLDGQTTKSRQFELGENYGATSPVILVNTIEDEVGDISDTPLGLLMKPVTPSYSASSLVNKWESVIGGLPSDNVWLVMICQVTGDALIMQFASTAHRDAAIAAFEACTGTTPVIGYDLAVESVTPETPSSFVWE
jgi:hypothetical protein